MKNKFFYLTLFFVLFINYGCKAQLMQTLNDANKIQSHKDYYAEKPFKALLKDIKPPIKAYFPLPDQTATKTAGLFLIFTSSDSYLRKSAVSKKAAENPATVGVYFTDIDAVNKIIKNRRGTWTQGLADSLSNLIIQRVYAHGKD